MTTENSFKTPSLEDRLAVRIKGVFALWREWLYSFGALTLVVLVGSVLSRIILPAVVLALAWLLNGYVAPLREKHLLACVRLASLTAAALVWSAVVMIICIVIVETPVLNDVFPPETLNPKHPFITALVVFPVTAVIMAYGLLTHGRSQYCRRCKMMLGCSPADSFAGNIFHREARYQLQLLMVLSLVISAILGIYYLVEYSNANFNSSDKYFFFIIPTVLFIVSLAYTGARCRSIIAMMQTVWESSPTAETLIRYLILRGDTVLLQTPEPANADEYVQADTPTTVTLPFRQQITREEGTKEFAKVSGLEPGSFELRPLYNNVTPEGYGNVFHYVVILDPEKPLPDSFIPKGEWATLDQINSLWRFHGVSRALAAEINRILTVTMAWKTYDENGYRRYPIKNYHPTFRLRDFGQWSVDYQDPVWLYVANFNQDKPMFHVRRLLRKLSGRG